MLKIAENELAIRRYERLFVHALKPLTSETMPIKLGHPGASEKAKVAWSERLGIWSFSRKITGLRYWHAFGIGRPEGGAASAITCEINFPLCGIDRRTGGAFAEDGAGRVFVIHRGKLGGGRKGVGKLLFENRYRGVWEVLEDGDEQTSVAVIGALQSPRFARQLSQFVHKIARLKESAVDRSAQAEMAFGEWELHDDLIGDPYPEGERETAAGCDRGLVIRDLADALKASGLRSGNDSHRDLAVMDPQGAIRAVFQVRSDREPTELLAAATRLLLEAADLPKEVRLCLLVPETSLEADLRRRLQRLQIDLMTYRWEGDRAVFPELETRFPRIGS